MVKMTFEEALTRIKDGDYLTRNGWNGRRQYVGLVTPAPCDEEEMTLPFIFISTVVGDRVPWVVSHTDLLAEDWEIL